MRSISLFCSLFQVLGDLDLDLELDLWWRREKTNLVLHLLEFLCNATILMFCNIKSLVQLKLRLRLVQFNFWKVLLLKNANKHVEPETAFPDVRRISSSHNIHPNSIQFITHYYKNVFGDDPFYFPRWLKMAPTSRKSQVAQYNGCKPKANL